MPKLTHAERQFIEECQQHYGQYYLAVHPDFKYVPYQQELIAPALEDVERGDCDRLMVLMHPGASKSDLCTAGFAPWFLGRKPDRLALVVSYGDKPAAEFGEKIRDAMTSDAYRQIFSFCKLKGAGQSRSYFQTTMGGKIYTAGWGGAIARIRSDLVLVDDPLKSHEEAMSEAIMEARMRTLNTVVKDRLRPGGRIVICTNRWASRDVVGRILEQEPERWRVITLPAEPGPDDPTYKYLEPDTRYLWESHYTKSRYEDKKKDPWAWEITYQQRPERAVPERFHRRWLQVYTHHIEPGQFHAIMIVDPALSIHKRADRTSIMVLGGGPQGRLFLLDWALDRLDPAQRTQAIYKLADKWCVDAILYEEVGMMSDGFYLRRDLDSLNIPIFSVGRAGHRHIIAKETRIMELIPDFREGRIVLPGVETDELRKDAKGAILYDDNGNPKYAARPEFWYRQIDGTRVDLMAYFIEEEYVRWAGPRSVAHDEGLDTLSRIHDPEFANNMIYAANVVMTDDEPPNEEGKFAGRGDAGTGGGWFSRF